MRNQTILDLADCTEFRQTIQARPPAIVHGTAVLLTFLLGTALAWSALTRANLVVRGSGRMRPVTTPVKVFTAVRGEVLSSSVGGRIAEVNVHEGDQVHRGDVLIRLETGRLDNEIARKTRLIRAGEEELTHLDHLEVVLTHQFEAARAKVQAELMQAREVVREARERQVAEIHLAQLALSNAERDEMITRRLIERAASTRDELAKAVAKASEAREQLAKARIPIKESEVAVAQRALELAERDYAVRRNDLELKVQASVPRSRQPAWS